MYNVRGVECFGCTCKRDCQLQIEIHIVYCVCGAWRCSRKLDETAKYTNGTESSSVQHVLKIVQCIRGKENNIKNTESFLAQFLSKQKRRGGQSLKRDKSAAFCYDNGGTQLLWIVISEKRVHSQLEEK